MGVSAAIFFFLLVTIVFQGSPVIGARLERSKDTLYHQRSHNAAVAQSVFDFAERRLHPSLLALTQAFVPFDSSPEVRSMLIHAIATHGRVHYNEHLCAIYGRAAHATVTHMKWFNFPYTLSEAIVNKTRVDHANDCHSVLQEEINVNDPMLQRTFRLIRRIATLSPGRYVLTPGP